VLEPTVVDATLELIDFDLHRISKLGGPLAHELGRGLRDVLQNEFNDRRARLVTRMNGQIEKHRDKLRISPRDLLQKGLDRLGASAPTRTAASNSAGRNGIPPRGPTGGLTMGAFGLNSDVWMNASPCADSCFVDWW
jgi:hypothetical protein